MIYALTVTDWDEVYRNTTKTIFFVLFVLFFIGLIAWLIYRNLRTSKDPNEPIITPKDDTVAEVTNPVETQTQKERKAPVLEIVACCLLGAFILGQIGNTLELTGGRFDAGLVAYTIGVLSLAIAALVLLIIDTVKRMR